MIAGLLQMLVAIEIIACLLVAWCLRSDVL
jgi:hypothetical protein